MFTNTYISLYLSVNSVGTWTWFGLRGVLGACHVWRLVVSVSTDSRWESVVLTAAVSTAAAAVERPRLRWHIRFVSLPLSSQLSACALRPPEPALSLFSLTLLSSLQPPLLFYSQFHNSVRKWDHLVSGFIPCVLSYLTEPPSHSHVFTTLYDFLRILYVSNICDNLLSRAFKYLKKVFLRSEIFTSTLKSPTRRFLCVCL